MTAKPELPILQFASQPDFEGWLEQEHARAPGTWLKIAKKGSSFTSVTYAEAVESALCFGWIDGQAKSLDHDFYLQRFTPRRPRSNWSEINCIKATELSAQGRMRPAGLEAIEAAKRDGRWERAYASPRNISVPDDFKQRLDENPAAREFFESLTGSNRYAILYRIHDAKRPETRARRIEKFVAMLAEGKTIH